MEQKQYYGIKFPSQVQDNDGYYLDLNKTLKDKVRSLLFHLIFTPKNQRIRRPDFGSDLIKYIFESNTTDSWNAIKSDIQEMIARYIDNVTINNINVLESERDLHEIYVRIDYTVQQGNKVISDSVVTRL